MCTLFVNILNILFRPVHRNFAEVPAGDRRATCGYQTVRGARHRWPWNHRTGFADRSAGARAPPRRQTLSRAGKVPATPISRTTVVCVHAPW